jgi:prolyl-tRNA synthetase
MPAIKREEWSRHFGKWFRHVLMKAEIMDYRYPVKGMAVWLPYGFKIRRNMLQVLRNLLDSSGHDEVLFPLLIPETSLEKESEHMKNFEGQVFWITRGGLTPLDVKLALRPTSETVIGPMLKLWIRSHADLPKKMYQIVNVFRYETKATRPLIRMREVDNFKEAHTVHATKSDAETQIREAMKIYKRFFDTIAVPYKMTKRPEWDKFAGAQYSIAFDQILPDGRTLQNGTVHMLGQNFAKAFGVTYETEKGDREYVWQTCYGISGRPIVGMLAAHGDDSGAVLPPTIAPTQVVIIPIPYKGMEKQIDDACKAVADGLKKAGIRVESDQRADLTPGAKYFYWELRGVPIRVEIGPRDIKSDQVMIVRRDTLEKQTCKTSDAVKTVKNLINAMMEDIRKKAWQWMNEHVHRVGSLDEAKKLIKKRAGIVETLWCGNAECGHKLGVELDADVLGTPEDVKEKVKGACVICGKKAESILRVAVAY